MSDLMARLRYYRCGDKTCAEIAARAASEIERLQAENAQLRKALRGCIGDIGEQDGDYDLAVLIKQLLGEQK